MRTRRPRWRGLLGAAALALFFAPPLAIAQSPPSTSAAADASPDSAVVYVARRGWHIDIGFAAADLKRPLEALTAEFPRARFLFFGFGDRRYLEGKDRRAPVLLAALWPGRGLILATALAAQPTSAFGATKVIALKLTPSQAGEVQAFIWRSLDEPRSYATGPYEGSLYFSATPKYSALHTCNTWAAEALAAGGLPIRGAGTVFASQLWRQVQRVEKKQRIQKKQSTVTHVTVDAGARPSAPS